MPGQIYLITTTTVERSPLFAHWLAAIVTCRTLGDSATWGDAHLLCWVLMPDHWHGLIQLGQRDSLAVVVNWFKSRVTKALHREAVHAGPVWARAYHDHALRAEENIIQVARHIVRNPVRARIVERVCDYPFWDASWL